LRPGPPGEVARLASTTASSKVIASSKPGRLPSTSAHSPAPSDLAARRCGIIESPPPFSRLCHRDPASDALSPSEHKAGRLDPIGHGNSRVDQAPLVDFCNQNNPRARLRDPPIPGSAHRRRSSPSLRWTGRRPPGWGWGPIHHGDRRIRVAPPASSLQRSSRIVEEGLHLAPAEVSRVRGRAAVPPGASRHVAPPSRGWHGARAPRERGIR